MRKPSLAPERNSYLGAPTILKSFFANKMGIFRFGSVFLILSLVALFMFNHSTRSRPATSANMDLGSPLLKYDFDGDGKSDLGRWRAASNDFTVRNSSDWTYTTYNLGSSPSSAVAAPGDYNGDGLTDAGIFNGTTWTFKVNPSATPQTITLSGAIPVAGDYDGDGKTDAAVYTPGSGGSNGIWQYKKSSAAPSATPVVILYGVAGDIPVPGYYNADDYCDIAVFRPVEGSSDGLWYISYTNGGTGPSGVDWGQNGDIPLQGDFDGDGISDLAVYRPSNGAWYWIKSSTGLAAEPVIWGSYADQPVPGDYLGSGRTDFAVWRPTTGVWHILENDCVAPPPYSCLPSSDSAPLGAVGDQAIESAYIRQIGSSVTGDVLGPLRMKPTNATGGTNLYSQNFGWSASLVNLPGRAGLDLNIGIGYNSLVWIKNGSTMHFDPDMSNVTPGFRLGFPVIEPVYYDSVREGWVYMMVTTSGARIEFLQHSAGNIYQTNNSSYTQLVTEGASNPNAPVEGITMTLKTTDGTQMSYEWYAGAFRCSKILDRNGNYISMGYDWQTGLLLTVTDTLGRTVNFEYDAELYPRFITQTWNTNNGQGSATTHTWAEFTYVDKTVDTNWDSSITTVVGPPDTTVVKVLDKIKYADGTSTRFDYNGYLQVSKVSTLAADTSLTVLNYVSTDLATPSSDQADCPRFRHTYTKVKDFNVVNGEAQETHVENTAPEPSSFAESTINESTKVVNVIMHDHPDDLYTKLHYADGDNGPVWRDGLLLATEDCIGEFPECSRQRWTATIWQQDEAKGSVEYGYPRNPRVIETQVGDAQNNLRGSTISYYLDPAIGHRVALFGLVQTTEVYDREPSTVVKRSVTEYNFHANYLNRRIIGLPSQVETWGKNDLTSNLEYVSKVTYGYDETEFTTPEQATPPSIVGHDEEHYGDNFLIRGNLTSTMRWDVLGQSSSVTSSIRYNATGSPVLQTDPVGRVTRIGYNDRFNSDGNPITFAYPTTITDPAGSSLGDPAHSSTIRYRYDIGANVEAISPPRSGTEPERKTVQTYWDDTGRPKRNELWAKNTEETWVEQTYTRYEYPPSGIESLVYATITDTNNNGVADTPDEVLTESWTDGAGRVLASRSPHTFNIDGTTATWAGTQARYDILGRVKKQSVPTEVASAPNPANLDNWEAAGDDATRDWLWTHQKYDWMGRVIRKINTDGADSPTLNDSDILISYDGCGCAGGLTTTIESERVPIPGATPSFGRRTQRVYADPLGRTYKTEVLNWSGSVYSTSLDYFNGRDQALWKVQFEGSGPSGRQVVMTYDGHGRMKTRHYPIEDLGANTIWNYNADDTIQNVRDPRDVVTHFTYNSRGMMTGISYDPGETGVADTEDVTFAFDNVGNRTSMADGTGSTSYAYNSLSQITSETKNISELSTSFTINYTYALNGAVASYTDPQDSSRKAEFSFDKIGRTIETRSTYQSAVTQKLHETQFRAWGALKKHTFLTVGSASSIIQPVEFEYDNRLQVSRHFTPLNPSEHNVEYTRNADGKVNLSNVPAGPTFTRNFAYDHAGRMTKSLSGQAVHSQSGTETPYTTTIAYNSFNEETSVSGTHWGQNNPTYVPTVSATTGRLSNASYDAAGNILSESVMYVPSPRIYTYDAANRNASGVDPGHRNLVYPRYKTTTYDGNGWQVGTTTFHNSPNGVFTEKSFEFRSSVLDGEVVGKWDFDDRPTTPEKREFSSMANDVKLKYLSWATFPVFEWLSPEGTTIYEGSGGATEELDIRGGALGTDNPYNGGGSYGGGGSRNDAEFYESCAVDGAAVSCSALRPITSYMHYILPAKRAVKRDPNNSALHAPAAAASRESTNTPTDKPVPEPAKNAAIAPALDPNNFVASLNMEWVRNKDCKCPEWVEPKVYEQNPGAYELWTNFHPLNYDSTAGPVKLLDKGYYKLNNDLMGGPAQNSAAESNVQRILTPEPVTSLAVRTAELVIGQDIATDALHLNFSFPMGAELNLTNTRNGAFLVGGSFDPVRFAKNMYYDLPKYAFKNGRSPFNLSVFAGGTKILASGNLEAEDRTAFYAGPSLTVTGGRVVAGNVMVTQGGTAIGLGAGAGFSITGGVNSNRLFTTPFQW